MNPTLEAILAQLTQMNAQTQAQLTQINQSNTQTQNQLTQIDRRFDQSDTKLDQMNQRFNQVGTLGKTHRAEPQEPIVPRYEPSSNPLSLSQPEPYRIDTPRFEPITFKPITYEPITLSLPTPVTPDFSQFSISQTPLTTPLVHQDDLEEEIYEADPSLVEEYEDNESIEDLEEEIPIGDLELGVNPELVNPVETQLEVNPELVESEV